MNDGSGMTDGLAESEAERLLAGFRYGAGADTVSNAHDLTAVLGGAGGSADASNGNATAGNSANTDEPSRSDGPQYPTNAGISTSPSDPTGPAEGRSTEVPEQLHRLLAAAAAPAHPQELRGYDSARRAFEAAGSGAGSRARGRHVASHPLARLAGVKLAALAGALTVTGVAVAAEAELLPSSIQHAAHRVFGGVGVPDHEPEDRDPTTAGPQVGGVPGTPRPLLPSTGAPSVHDSTSGSTATNGDATSAAGTHQDPATISEAIDLCRAYVASPGNGSGALPQGKHRRLAELAGGAQNIDQYCAGILATATATATAPGPVTGPVASTPSVPQPTTPVIPSRTHPSHDPKSPPTTDPNANLSASDARKTH